MRDIPHNDTIVRPSRRTAAAGEDVESVTESNGNTLLVPSENLSVEKSRTTNTPDGEGTGDDDVTGDESDSSIL